MKNELLYLVWYADAMNFLPTASKKLEKYSVFDIYGSDAKTLCEKGFTDKQVKRLSFKGLERAMQILRYCDMKRIRIISLFDSDYPMMLKKIPDPPIVLYVRGDASILNSENCVGFVGTRSSTYEGECLAERLATELTDEGCTVVSGGAEGIDTVGLITALENKSPCIAVLGCDIDKVYPQKNERMFSEIVRCGGAVISEYPPGTGARWFPARNRIIAGLSKKVYIPEAPEESGALITAQYAKTYGIPVYAPNIDGDSFSGCRMLTENGAFVIDVRCNVPRKKEIITKETAAKEESRSVQKDVSEGAQSYGSPVKDHVMLCILEGRNIPDRMVTDEFKINKILVALTQLELCGEIEELPGNRYGKKW